MLPIAHARDGAQAVLHQRGCFGGLLGCFVAVMLRIGKLAGAQKGSVRAQNIPVGGYKHIPRCHIGQEQKIIADARAHARTARMPPVLHIALHILARGAQQQMRPRALRLGIEQRQHILQLIAESPCAARLVEARAQHQPRCAHLIGQKAVGVAGKLIVGQIELQRVQLPCPAGAGAALAFTGVGQIMQQIRDALLFTAA